jgi:hypothetical protein
LSLSYMGFIFLVVYLLIASIFMHCNGKNLSNVHRKQWHEWYITIYVLSFL